MKDVLKDIKIIKSKRQHPSLKIILTTAKFETNATLHTGKIRLGVPGSDVLGYIVRLHVNSP